MEAEAKEIKVEEEETLSEYYTLKEHLDNLRNEIRETVTSPIHAVPYLQPGRLVKVVDGDINWGWGVIINFQKKQEKGGAIAREETSSNYIVDVLLNCSSENPGRPQPAPKDDKGVMQVVPTVLSMIEVLSTVRVYIPKDLRSVDSKDQVRKSIREVAKRFPDGIPVLDPIEDMKIDDEDFKKVIRVGLGNRNNSQFRKWKGLKIVCIRLPNSKVKLSKRTFLITVAK